MTDFNPVSNWEETAKRLLGDDFWNSIASQTNMNPLGKGLSSSSQVNTSAFPMLDLIENEHEFTVIVDLPGVRHPQNIAIYVEGNTLTLKGELPKSYPPGDIRQSERRRGKFERNLELPSAVQKDRTKAEFENGVLVLKLQKYKTKTNRVQVPIDF